jgi:hypothetical protein
MNDSTQPQDSPKIEAQERVVSEMEWKKYNQLIEEDDIPDFIDLPERPKIKIDKAYWDQIFGDFWGPDRKTAEELVLKYCGD